MSGYYNVGPYSILSGAESPESLLTIEERNIPQFSFTNVHEEIDYYLCIPFICSLAVKDDTSLLSLVCPFYDYSIFMISDL